MIDFRFRFSHEIEGDIEFSEPGGFDSAIMGFTRLPLDQGASLVEVFRSNLYAYGNNGNENSGRDWFKMIERTYGPDATINCYFDLDEGDGYQNIFTGSVPISMFIETLDDDLILELAAAQAGFWVQFQNAVDTPVDVQSTTDLQGNPVEVIDLIQLPLPSQKIRKSFIASVGDPIAFVNTGGTQTNTIVEFPGKHFFQIGPNVQVNDSGNFADFTSDAFASLDDVNIKFLVPENNDYLFTFLYEVSLRHGHLVVPNFPAPPANETITYDSTLAYLKFYIQINDETPIEFSKGNTGGNHSTQYSYNDTLTLKQGDTVKVWADNFNDVPTWGDFDYYYIVIYGQNADVILDLPAIITLGPPFSYTGYTFPPGDDPHVNPLVPTVVTLIKPSGNVNYSTETSRFDSVFPDSVTPALLIHDVAASIIKRTCGADLVAPFLGGPLSFTPYVSKGCGYPFVNFPGLWARGYTPTAKPWSYSWKDFWGGIYPTFNVGFSYTADGKIEIKKQEEYFDASQFSIKLSNVVKIKRHYDTANFFNAIEIGNEKWESEDVSGLDDPQTKRTYATILKNIGVKISLLSKWIAGSLTLEGARRTSIVKSTDYKYDNDVFVVSVVDDGDSLKPETDEDFSSVTGLLNEATRYNKRLTPARALLRFRKYLSSGLYAYFNSAFKFTGGEGNYDMAAAMSGACDDSFSGAILSEKQDIQVTEGLFCPQLYEIEHDLTLADYNLVQANRHLAIGISQTDVNHKPFFIQDFQFAIVDGQVKIVAWPKDYFEIVVPESPAPPTPGLKARVWGPIFSKIFGPLFED